MPTYRVSYFQSRGRAEVMRQILEYSGQKYEDRRFEQKAWEKVKPCECKANDVQLCKIQTWGYIGEVHSFEFEFHCNVEL